MWRSLGCAFLAGNFVGAEAGRISRKREGHSVQPDAKSDVELQTKFIAGVPVFNYENSFAASAVASAESPKESWIVSLNEGTSDAQIESLCQFAPEGCNVVGHPSSGGVPFLEFRGTEQDLKTVLEASAGVAKFAEPDQMMYAIPDMDEGEGQVQPSSAPWGLERIGAPQRSGTGRGVNIYILDTGIRASHNDFGGRVVPTLDMTSGSAVECQASDSTCAGDGHSHGTHCAGSAAGTTYGVAPQATLRSVKVLGDGGSGERSWTLAGLDFLATKGVRPAIASMSLGSSGRTDTMQAAVDAVVATGITVVVAGGNSNTNACNHSPAFVQSAITVGSTSSTDGRSWFSNYGPCTDIWAPGSSIISAGIASDIAVLTKSGTSMACPHVAGAAALLLEGVPDLTPNKVREQLLSSAATAYISDLRLGDTNKLLFVGAGGAPLNPNPVPTPGRSGEPCPSEFSFGPDSDGDCQCTDGLTCFEGGRYKCTFSLTTPRNNRYHYKWFSPSCTDCYCLP